MAYNKKVKVFTIKRSAFAAIGILFIAFILFGGYLFYKDMISEADSNTPDIEAASSDNSTAVVRVKSGMNQGELLDVSMLEIVEVPVGLIPKGTVTSFAKLNNMRLKRGVSEKEFLNDLDLVPDSAWYEDGDRLIEHNFAEGAVPAAVAEGSIIDIKLFVKGEEDRIVISKAAVVSRSANLMSFYMNQREQELLKESATEGALFAVQYLDDSQRASDITYVPIYEKGKE